MTNITSDQLTKSIKDILKDGDLDQLSAKKIRKMLETEYKTDFMNRKEEIDKLVMKLITENDEEEKKEKKSKPSKASNGKSAAKQPVPTTPENKASDKTDDMANSENKDGSEDDDDSDIGEIEDSEVVPKKKAKVQTSGKKLNDEELAKKLQEDEDLRPSRRCKAQPAVKKPRKQAKERAKGTSVYSRPCELLPPLNKVLETERMPRPMIVKRLWEIVKERNLLDPKNKQFMLCDSEMLELFGKKKVRMFGMMKLLKPYIKDLPKE